RRDARGERIRRGDDGAGVIRNQDLEDAADEGPRRLAGFYGARRRLLERRIDKPIPRADGGEDPRPKSPLLARERQPPDPARIDLQLLARGAVDDRDRRGRATEIELDDGEAMERGVRDRHALAREQLANLRQANALLQPLLNRDSLLAAAGPAVPAWTAPGGMQREHHIADLRLR